MEHQTVMIITEAEDGITVSTHCSEAAQLAMAGSLMLVAATSVRVAMGEISDNDAQDVLEAHKAAVQAKEASESQTAEAG